MEECLQIGGLLFLPMKSMFRLTDALVVKIYVWSVVSVQDEAGHTSG
jgi:hypothetical protein